MAVASDWESSKNPLPSVPTLLSLVEELKTVFDWQGLGLRLGIAEHQLKEIKADNFSEVAECRYGMLSCWLKATVSPSWEEVIAALRKMKEWNVAARIKHKCESITIGHTGPDMVDDHTSTLECSEETLIKLEQLEAEHATMLTKVKKCFKKRTSTKKFVDTVSNFLDDADMFFRPRDYDNAYRQLIRHTDTFNNHTLHCVARALRNRRVIELVSDYEKKKGTFLNDTKVKDFQKAVEQKAQTYSIEPYIGMIIKIKLKGRWTERTLKDIDYLVNNLFGVRSKAFLKPIYQEGCILVSWEVPFNSSFMIGLSLDKCAAYMYVQDVDYVAVLGPDLEEVDFFDPAKFLFKEDDVECGTTSLPSPSHSPSLHDHHLSIDPVNFFGMMSSEDQGTVVHKRSASVGPSPLEPQSFSRCSSLASSIASSVGSLVSIGSLPP